jgi:hypothetical protein
MECKNELNRKMKIAFNFYKWREAIEYLAKNRIACQLRTSDNPNDTNNYSNLSKDEKDYFEYIYKVLPKEEIYRVLH